MTQQGLALVQPGKSHPVLLAGKTLTSHHVVQGGICSLPRLVSPPLTPTTKGQKLSPAHGLSY